MDASTDNAQPHCLSSPRRRRRSGSRPRPLCRRCAAAEPGLCVFRALAACLRPHRLDRRQRRRQCAGRDRRLDRQRHGRRRQSRPPSAGPRPRRQGPGPAAPAGARHRSCRPYRRAGGDGGRRDRGRGAGRRRIRLGRIRRIDAGDRRARSAAPTARRKSGRRRPAISRSIGRDRIPIRTPMRKRSRRFSPRRNTPPASR